MADKNVTTPSKATKAARPRGPKPVYIMFRGDAEILEGFRKPEQVLAMIDDDPSIKYQKIDIA